MALTNDAQVARRMAMLRTHGITRDADLLEQVDAPAWHYEQQLLGFNYRMMDLQAALGLSQLARIESFIERRCAIAVRYDDALRGGPVQCPVVRPLNRSAHHLYVIRVAADVRRWVFEAMRRSGVGVNVHYMPVHLQPYYRARGWTEGHCPEAERHGREAISLPLYPGLRDDEQQRVIDVLRSALGSPRAAVV
jgi:dTDP-4-amino-4,6-dideoxygalactose transaminase